MTTQPQRPFSRTLRYLAPNAVTAASIVFAILAVQATVRGEIIWGCWWALYSTLTDKLDGYVARLVKGSSPIGVQMDSLADLLNYGFVPAAITYAFFYNKPELGWAVGSGLPYFLLCAICCTYVLCAALRLARFNISSSNPNFFFGIPSTMSGAMVLAILIMLGKYGNPAWTRGESYPGPRLLDSLRLDFLMPLYPWILLFFGWTMVSSWRVPKLGKLRSRFANRYIIINLVIGYGTGILHCLPEYFVFGGLQYMLIAAYAHFFATPPERPEPFFPP